MVSTTFKYRAVDAQGAVLRGELDGDDLDPVAERLKRMGLRPVSIVAKRAQFAQRELRMPGFGGARANALALFSRQLATMIDAGTPILKCLTVLEAANDDRLFASAIASVRADVENGDPLSDALERHPRFFDGFFVSMVRSGESAGSLPLVLDRLATATEGVARLRKKIKSALAYPTAVACLIGLTVLAMLLFLIPTFSDIFKDLHGTLPLPTRIVVGASDLLIGYFPFVVLVVGAGIWWFRRWKRTTDGRRRWDGIRLRIPVFGTLASQTALARFSRSLAVLTSTNVPMVDALRIARSTASNEAIAEAVDEVARAVNNGGRISDAMSDYGDGTSPRTRLGSNATKPSGTDAPASRFRRKRPPIFTPMVVQMVAVGEDTGAIDEMLEKVSDLYEQEVNATVDGLTSLLEPLLIVAMGLTVGGMLLAVYLPMFRAVSLIR